MPIGSGLISSLLVLVSLFVWARRKNGPVYTDRHLVGALVLVITVGLLASSSYTLSLG
jgi:hypothetical protein